MPKLPERNNLRIGFLGEKAACEFLQKKGFTILERNARKGYGELDIVARAGKTLVFVEVKTRRGSKYGTPEEAITPWKLQTLVRSAQYYKLRHPSLPDLMRIDAVCVSLTASDTVEKISHYPNVTGF